MVGGRPVELLVAVLGTRPLRLHVSLYNHDGSEQVAWVPRTLRPLGLFARVAIRTLGGETVFETSQPKVKRKLDPAADDSYLGLEPGYSFGTVLEIDLGDVPGGMYVTHVAYDNHDYTGTPSREVGDLSLIEVLEVDVADEDPP